MRRLSLRVWPRPSWTLRVCIAVAAGIGLAVPATSVAAATATTAASEGNISVTASPGLVSGDLGPGVAPAATVTRTGSCTNIPGTPCKVDFNTGRGTSYSTFFYSDGSTGSKAYTCTANKCGLTATAYPDGLGEPLIWDITGPNVRIIRVY